MDGVPRLACVEDLTGAFGVDAVEQGDGVLVEYDADAGRVRFLVHLDVVIQLGELKRQRQAGGPTTHDGATPSAHHCASLTASGGKSSGRMRSGPAKHAGSPLLSDRRCWNAAALASVGSTRPCRSK